MLNISRMSAILLIGVIFASFPFVQADHHIPDRATLSSVYNVSNSIQDSREASLISVAGATYMVWSEKQRVDNINVFHIFFSKSLDAGATWSAPVNLNPNMKGQWPVVAATDSAIYVVWEEVSTGNWEVFLTKSTDGGATWSAPKNLSTSAGMTSKAAIKAVGNSVYVAYRDHIGNWEVMFTRSTDSGATFTTPKNISNTAGVSVYFSDIQLQTSGSSVHIIWGDTTFSFTDIFYARSLDGGNTFTTTKLIDTPFDITYPQVIATGSNVYMIWEEYLNNSNHEVFFTRSTDSGATWSASKNISNNAGYSASPNAAHMAATADGAVFVTWEDTSYGNREIMTARSVDGGVTWGAPIMVSQSPALSTEPFVFALDSERVALVWMEASDFYSAVPYPEMKHSSDGGATWSEDIDISGTGIDDFNHLAVLTSSGAITVVWEEAYTNRDIMARAVLVDGWGANQPPPPPPADTVLPILTVDTPTSGQQITGPSSGVVINLSGTASDSQSGISKVEIRLDSGAFVAASGTQNWSGSVTITTGGTHTITVRATDGAGNTNTVTIPVVETRTFQIG